jgi:hypothetical protein
MSERVVDPSRLARSGPGLRREPARLEAPAVLGEVDHLVA